MPGGDADLLDKFVGLDFAIGEVADYFLAIGLEGGESDYAGGWEGFLVLEEVDIGGFLGGEGAGDFESGGGFAVAAIEGFDFLGAE